MRQAGSSMLAVGHRINPYEYRCYWLLFESNPVVYRTGYAGPVGVGCPLPFAQLLKFAALFGSYPLPLLALGLLALTSPVILL